MRTIAIINQKGGCGKTTTAINLSAVLAERGHRTLLVDLDPQSHCAAGLAVPPASIEYDIGDAMLKATGNTFSSDKLLWRVSRNLDLAPSRTKLAALEATRGGLASAPEREYRLKRVLDRVDEETTDEPFAFAVVDCPPGIGLLTYNAITAADEIIIPVETSFFSLQGATKQAATIQSLSRRLGTKPTTRLLATIHDPDHALAQDLREELSKRFKNAVIPVTIRQDQRVREAASYGQPITAYAPESTGAEDYRSLGEWVIEGGTTSLGTPDHDEQALSGEGMTIESKPSELPLGARRKTARPLPKTPAAPDRGTELTPAVSAPTTSGAEPGNATATQTERAAETATETETTGEALETLSRVEDLARRAAALSERVRTAPEPRTQTRLRSTSGAVRLVEEIHDTDRRTKSVARLFGVRVQGGRAVFVQPIELGMDVRVAGEFNGWSATATPMRRNEPLGVHELMLDAPRGRTRYRLVVDGRWLDDQFNPVKERNEFGDMNSVVEVP